MDNATRNALADALVFRTRTGTPALSFDDGGTVYDPRGRKVPAGAAWAEADDDPEAVWPTLTDAQRQVVVDWVAHLQATAARKAAATTALADEIAALPWAEAAEWNVRRIGRARLIRAQGLGLCACLVKRGGYRMHPLPVSAEQALGLAQGTLKLVYWTNSTRAEVVPA